MHSAIHGGRARPTATFILTLTLASLSSAAALAQQGGTAEEKSTEQKIQELSEDLRTRGVELDELHSNIEKHKDRSAAAMMDKELSNRRASYRRDVSELVTLVLNAEDAGATVADGRSLAEHVLQVEAAKMREKLTELSAVTLRLVDVSMSGSAEEIEAARKSLSTEIPRASRLIEYLDDNIDARAQL